MADRFQFRRDTAANWASANPVLADGEIGLETDTRSFKIGDGVTAWTSLQYQAEAKITGATTLAVVATLPASPDPNTIYFTTT